MVVSSFCTLLTGTHMSSYFFLFSVTLLQYFVTCGSSPLYIRPSFVSALYVIDAMRDVDETNAIMYRYAPTTSFVRLVIILVLVDLKNCLRCQKMVLDLYPPGTSLRNLTCGYCHVEQVNLPMFHLANLFLVFSFLNVLQFDHHCVWLGTCLDCNLSFVLWYICEESALCIWTLIMYIDYLTNVAKPWWKNAVIILLLVVLVISLIFVLLLLLFHRSNLILTNQSTYELVRRKRIPYMRNMPERVHPFSRGIKRNLYNVCCGNDTLDSLPTAYELEDRSRSYTCLDMLKCRCC
uniref:S-acyltransferase n=1 Tax=Brassica oleracea TaxID=3712 RepID=A0A3P6FYF2_BRAOL|nr:unnamed protein product [Brassica oleracea]